MVTASAASAGGFRRWRRARPFWGGLLLLIAGVELFFSANLTLGDLEVHFGPEGFLSYLLPLLLILAGVLTWVSPGQRLFYGIIGLLTAVYSLIGLNLGGFGLGMLIGIIGGALVLAWAPKRPQPAAAPAEPGAEAQADGEDATPPTGHDDRDHEYQDQDHQDHDQDQVRQGNGRQDYDPAATMILPGFGGGSDDSGSDTAPLRPAHRPDPAQQFPDAPAYPGAEHPPGGEPPPPPPGGIYRKTFVIALIPLAMTAALLIAGGQHPARAEATCPEGLPSRPAAEAKREAAKQSSAKPSPARAAAKKAPKAHTTPSLPAAVSPSGAEKTKQDESDNPIVDGWNGFVDGVGDLLGIGDEEETATEAGEQQPDETEPAPAGSASAPANPSPSASSSPSGGVPSAPGPPGSPEQSGSPAPSASASSASPSPTPSLSDIPCLGPRVFKKVDSGDLPQVAFKPGLMETASLTMYDSTYDGVEELRTSTGIVRALKFSMTKAVNKPFKITVPEAGRNAVKTSDKLVAEGDVRFYTTKFQGKLFGVIPITFTPDAPPPLTLPVLWFTDAKIELALVQCKTMRFDSLEQTERS